MENILVFLQELIRSLCLWDLKEIYFSVHTGDFFKWPLTTTDTNGIEEFVAANELFYWPPGHNVKVDEDAEIVMFSPQHKHSNVINHMIDTTKG